MTNLNIENLMVQANPIADSEQMRLPSAEMATRCASILDRRDVMTAATPTEDQVTQVRPERPRFRPALAFALGLSMILATVGGVVLWAGGGDDGVVDEPTVTTVPPPTSAPPTTSPPPPTTMPSALDGRIDAPDYADVPSFTGVVEYYEHDPATGETGWHATVAVGHAGPMAFEATVLAESGESQILGGADTVFFGDGSDVWVMEGGYLGPFPMPFVPFRHLFFDGEHRLSAWDDICGSAPNELGIETIAGRTATHFACSSDLEDYELWIDEESGLVLKLIGPVGIGDYSPYLARDGLFEFTEIVFESVETPAAPEPATAVSELAVPPLHMIRRDSGEYWKVHETWYFDGRTLRETVIDAADASHIGSFIFAVDGQAGGCFPSVGFCEVEELADGQTYSLFNDVPEDLVAKNCAHEVDDTVADRPARHYTCDGLRFVAADSLWRAATDAGAGGSEYWFDTATGLIVKVEMETWSYEATLLETNPQFPAGIFQYEEPEYAAPDGAITVGDAAPRWSGPLVDGGTFDMADQAEKYVVVYNWSPHYGVIGLDHLYEFQLLFDSYAAESLTFVSVSEDTLAETQQVLDRMGITVPTVHCGWDPDPVCHSPDYDGDLPASPWFLWGNDIPSVTVIGPDGVTLGVFLRPPVDDELETLLADLSG